MGNLVLEVGAEDPQQLSYLHVVWADPDVIVLELGERKEGREGKVYMNLLEGIL